jgi:tetratricopeptide (TPR) repeat protein
MEYTLDQALQKGVEAHKAGKVQEADRYYTAILKANPNHPDANHNMGVLAVGIGKVETALPFFKTALDTNPNIDQFWISYIDALIKLDRLDEASEVFKTAKTKGVKGNGFEQLKKRLAELEQDTEVNDTPRGTEEPPDAKLQNLINLYTQSQYKEALHKSSKLVEQFPNSIHLYNIIGAANQNLGQLDEAIEAYNKALIIKPDFAEVYYNMGNVLKDQGKLDEAIDAYNKALSLKPDIAEVYNNIGVVLKDQGKLKEAMEAYNKALSINPDYTEAYNNMGNALKDQGKLEEAIETYTKALFTKPNYAVAYNNIGNALKDTDKLDEAIEAYKTAISIKPNYADAYYNMGVTIQQQGKKTEAIQAYKKALSINPDYADAYYNIGNAFQGQGKLEEAIEAYKKALSIKPNYPNACNNMGNALQDQGKLKEALEAYNRALSLKPDLAEAYSNIGNAFKDQGKLKEAIEAYTKALSIEPDLAEAIENASSLRNQLTETKLITEEFEERLESNSLELVEMPNFQIHQAIRSFLLLDHKLVRKHLNNYSSCPQSLITELKVTDQSFCSAYNSYLQKLIETPLENEETLANCQTIFHIGESHCLSYAHRQIKLQGINCTIAPRITFGAKAFHFSTSSDNRFKAITKANFQSLPESSKVFLSFGEIDCRPNEGFISATKKHRKRIEDLVSNTTRKYVGWFAEQNQTKNHSLHFFNVPAPIYSQKHTAEINENVATIIKLFNRYLEEIVLNYEFNLIDVYEFTVGGDEFSNGSFHIDDYHLSSFAIPEIEKQIGAL